MYRPTGCRWSILRRAGRVSRKFDLALCLEVPEHLSPEAVIV